jgi:hypothetical protein
MPCRVRVLRHCVGHIYMCAAEVLSCWSTPYCICIRYISKSVLSRSQSLPCLLCVLVLQHAQQGLAAPARQLQPLLQLLHPHHPSTFDTDVLLIARCCYDGRSALSQC